MMRIRPEQIRTLADVARPGVEDRLVAHLLEHFPDECTELGESLVRAAVRGGTARASRYGITSTYGVCRFLNLAFVFGHRFDEEMPWAGEILAAGGDDCLDRLHRAALDHLGANGRRFTRP